MANRYFVHSGVAQDWNASNTACWSATNGGAGGASVPTSADDVFFTSLSGSFDNSMNGFLSCRSLDTTGYTGQLTWGSTTARLDVYGSIKVTRPINGTTTNGIRMLGAGATFTIDVSANIAGAAWQIGNSAVATFSLASQLNCASLNFPGIGSGTIAFQTNGFNVISAGVISLTTGTSFQPSTSTITCGSWSAGNANLMVNAGASTINCSGGWASTSTNTYGTVNLTPIASTATYNGSTNTTYANLTLDYSNNICATTTLVGTHTVTGTFTIIGNNRYPKIQNGTINAANVNITNVLFSNTTFGGAATWTGTNTGLFGSAAASGSTFTYTTGDTNICTASGSQNWYDPSIWSLGRVPLPQDDVIIRRTSSANLQFTNTLNTFPGYIKSFKLETTSTGGVDFTLATDFYITGGLQFDAGTFMPKGAIVRPSFTLNATAATAGSYNITNLAGSGVQLQNLSTNNTLSTYTITNDLSCNGAIQMLSGTLIISDNVNLDMFNFFANSATVRTLTFGNNVSVRCWRNWWLHPTNLTVNNLLNTPILISDTTSSAITFGTGSAAATGGVAYGEVTFAGSSTNVSMHGSNSFKKLSFVKSGTNSFGFHGGITTTVDEWNVTGLSGGILNLYVTAGTTGPANIAKSSAGINSSNYLNINNVTVSPTTNTWYAGGNSVNGGGTVTGWIFTNPPGTSVNSLFFGSFF